MKVALGLIFFSLLFFQKKGPQKIFDVHIHGQKDIRNQLQALEASGVYKAAISTSWELQNSYRGKSKIKLLHGLMFPCPNGKVPYSLQNCYSDAGDWPSIDWVAKQIKDKKIDYFGEVIAQYYGISSSDTLLYPYYALAEKNQLPVGIHTGGAGPDHGSPNFKMEMGNPLLLQPMLKRFPKLKVWIMHSGEPFLKEAISVMRDYKTAYCDISAISNPHIVPEERFHAIMKSLIDAGLEDRIMFGSDNGDIVKVVSAVYALDFLSEQQKDKIFFKNAEKFFSKK